MFGEGFPTLLDGGFVIRLDILRDLVLGLYGVDIYLLNPEPRQ